MASYGGEDNRTEPDTYKSTADRAAVRTQAAEALRTGQIPSGEFSAM